ncbi:ribonuclease R [Peptoniphilus stercorisuis]|uniref:Ribonuclease R n=1 Tax=Peptoniphilus stercorisuis TaxID=1436965 RepID=A0ABS4KH06_9FIRM|nr:ribonuclease R [Peptoniphilus stercorisuis]MBP2025894.1 ribonuclease R [Peptoniphilus stercorisuis]
MIKEKILDVLKNSEPMSKEQIAKLFEIKNKEKKSFYKLIEELQEEGEIFLDKQSSKYFVIDGENFVTGKIQGNERGFGFLLQEDGDIFISADHMNSAMNGDTVVGKLLDKSSGNSDEGEVIAIIERKNEKIVGTLQDQRNFGFVVPDESKIAYDIFIPKKFMKNAKNGQKVLVKIDKWPKKDKKPEGQILEILGFPGEKGVEILSVAATYNLPMSFTKKTISEAKKIPQEVTKKMLEHRADLRDLKTFTIDGADSKDFDDAVSIEILENGNFYLGVHIADVSHYVKEKDELDKEAYKRGNSVYLVDKVIPMLPKELSNGICSLNEGVDRLTLSVFMEVNKNGSVVNNSIVESVINSHRRLIYDNVSDFIENKAKDKSIEGLEEELTNMAELAEILSKKRQARGSIDFDFPEAKIIVDESGHPVNILKEERRVANRLIEEFMILCNEVVSEQHFWMEVPFLYRIHEEPEEERINSLNKTIRHLGYKLNTQNMNSRDVQSLIDEVKGKEEELFVSTLVLRSLRKAKYSAEQDIHFGLASKYYSHFTSPIRRYADLTIHRIIKDIIHSKLNDRKVDYLESELPNIADHVSKTEKLAQEAERTVESIKMAEYMKDRIGEEYEGIISSITSFGIFVQLENTIEGLIGYNSMDDYFEFNEDEYTAVGRDTNKIYHMGDRVNIRVVNTNVTKGTIDFEFVGD